MPRRRNPHPAYWEYLYSAVVITATCAAVLLLHGNRALGFILLATTAAEAVMVIRYRRRARRG